MSQSVREKLDWFIFLSSIDRQRQTTFDLFFTTISTWPRAWHIDVSSVVWTLINNCKLANRIVRLVAIVVKSYISYSVIVRVMVVFKRTVVGDCCFSEVLFRVKWIMFFSQGCCKSGLFKLIGQFGCDGIEPIGFCYHSHNLWVCNLAILFQTHWFLLSVTASGRVTFRPNGFCYHRDSLWLCNLPILFQTHWFLFSQSQSLAVELSCLISDPLVPVLTVTVSGCVT